MATRAPFLTTRFGGYYHRDIPQEDTELTHIGPGTPCGEYLRRFWQPVCFTDDLRDLPRRVTLLGEDLVAFRDGRAPWGCSNCTVPTVAPRWSLGCPLRVGSGAATMAGCSMSTGLLSRPQASPRPVP
jgi:hypothetical protein